MKKLIISTFIFLCFINHVLAQPCYTSICNIVAQPDPTFCHGGIDKYLARSISMHELTDVYGSTEYCQDIGVCVELRAAFLRRVAHIWGWEKRMQIGQPYHTNATNTARQINNAYDCAGLRRPIIQAAILEYISDQVDNIQIPQYVLDHFEADHGEHPIFVSEGYTTTGTYYFYLNQIETDPTVPDLTRIQARMWYYYLATQYLDMGYSAIHMGRHEMIAKYDPLNIHVYRLYSMIRNYAAHNTPPDHPKFVLLDAHLGKPVYYNNTNSQIYDFLSSPIRPDEEDFHVATNVPCLQSENNARLNYRRFVPGMNERPSHGFQGLLPGQYDKSPLGCDVDYTPIVFEWDWHSGTCTAPPHSGWCPYGYDESKWFGTLSSACQAYWNTSAVFATKNDLAYRGYFMMPGRIPGFRMHDNSQLVNDSKNKAWAINTYTNFSVDENCHDCYSSRSPKAYTLKVTNPDGSSVYAWHVEKPDGSWLPVVYGTERVLCDLPAGTYKVYLNQDNRGSLWYAETVQYHKDIVVTTECGIWEDGEGERRYQGNSSVNTETVQNNSVKVETVHSNNQEIIKVYPNPSKSGIFQLETSRSGHLEIFDGSGKKVLEQETSNKTIDLSKQPIGVYMLKFTTAEGVENLKITVQ